MSSNSSKIRSFTKHSESDSEHRMLTPYVIDENNVSKLRSQISTKGSKRFNFNRMAQHENDIIGQLFE